MDCTIGKPIDSCTRTELDQRVGELLAVDGDATQQVDELVVGQEVVQQHPVVHLVFPLKQSAQRDFLFLLTKCREKQNNIFGRIPTESTSNQEQST